MYRYEGQGLCVSTRGRILGGGTRAHKVHKGCLQGGGTTGIGVLRRYLAPSWEVSLLTLPRSACCGRRSSLSWFGQKTF